MKDINFNYLNNNFEIKDDTIGYITDGCAKSLNKEQLQDYYDNFINFLQLKDFSNVTVVSAKQGKILLDGVYKKDYKNVKIEIYINNDNILKIIELAKSQM